MKKVILGATVSILLIGQFAWAGESAVRHDLQRAINEINMAKTYVRQAKKHHSRDARRQFAFDKVLSELAKIEGQINQELTTVSIEPNRLSPIKGDYHHRRRGVR